MYIYTACRKNTQFYVYNFQSSSTLHIVLTQWWRQTFDASPGLREPLS